MTAPTDANLARIEARAKPRLRLTLDCRREVLPLIAALRELRRWNTTLERREALCNEHWQSALTAWDEEHEKVREAREALGPFAAFYSALIAHEERGIYPPPDDREIARFLGEGGPLSLTVGDVRRIARIVESGSAGLPQHESADGVPD